MRNENRASEAGGAGTLEGLDRCRRPSPSLVISVLALFVALSGSALALSRGEVKSKHIAKNAVRSKHVHKNAVKAKHVRNGVIRTAKLADGAVTEAKLAEGLGITGIEFVFGHSAFNSDSSKTARADCPADKAPIAFSHLLQGAGTGNTPNFVSPLTVTRTLIDLTGAEVRAAEVNATSKDWLVRVRTLCAKVAA